MGRLFICGADEGVTADIETRGTVLNEALEHEQAEAVFRCAVLMSLSALAEGGPWPTAMLQTMAAFMTLMRDELTGGLLQ